MSQKLVTPPTKEPVSLSEVKRHLRVDGSHFDKNLTDLITSSREWVEEMLGRALITQTWRMNLDCWPRGDTIQVVRSPLQSVTSVKYYGTDDTEATFTSYDVDTDVEPGEIQLDYGANWPSTTLRPSQPIQIEFIAGDGDDMDDVPRPVRDALILHVGLMHHGSDPATERAVDMLLMNYRIHV